MARITDTSIELTKLKSAITTTAKGTKCIMIPIDQDGINLTEKGQVFLNTNVTVNDEKNVYGQDVSVTIKQTKEQRESNDKKVYIGNGKTVWKSENEPKEQEKNVNKQNETNSDNSNIIPDGVDDLPF